jgi:hypothetical protein
MLLRTQLLVLGGRPVGVAAILVAACTALLLTAPVNGDFWWSDAPRHALNGVFVRDIIAAHPIHQPMQWAIDYYLRRPALTIMFYPPLFYVAEAVTYTFLGVSQFAAQLTVTLFILLLSASSYRLARLILPRWSAVGASLLVIGTPEAALWGRQVMLDLPAYALIAASAVYLAYYVRNGRPYSIYVAAAFLLAAIYTKYNAGFIAPALAAAFVMAKGRAAFKDRHALAAGVLAVVGLLPAIFILTRFGSQNLKSMSGLSGTLPLNSLDCWLYYLEVLPAQLGWLTTLLCAGGCMVLVHRVFRGRVRWPSGLLLAWLLVGYVFFSLISLKEPRDSLMVLLPLAVAAPLCLLVMLPGRLGELAGLGLGAGTMLYTLIVYPVPRIEGYHEIVSYLAKNVPIDGMVVYFGYRDGNLIFDLSARTGRPDITVVRVDKLLLSAPVGERRRGIQQADYDEAAIARMVRDLGASYLIVQPDFWSDLPVLQRFVKVVTGPEYVKVAHFAVTGDLSTQDGNQGIDVLRPTVPPSAPPGRLSIDMPLAGQRFDGTPRP